MMRNTCRREKGVVMMVSLLLLIILSIIGFEGMSSSTFNLRMAGNIQNLYDSFQVADAGIAAAMADGDSFDGTDQADIFAGGTSGSIEDFIVAEVNVTRLLPDVELECPRSSAASSITFIGCEHYTVDSEHNDAVSGARTRLFEGTAKEILVH